MMKAMPGLPHFYLNVCDVRDVANAHVECMNNPDAVGQLGGQEVEGLGEASSG